MRQTRDDWPGAAKEWEDADPTDVTTVQELDAEPTTAPHDLAELPGFEVGRERGAEAGYRRGFAAGCNEFADILRSAFKMFEHPDDVAEHVIAWCRSRLPPL